MHIHIDMLFVILIIIAAALQIIGYVYFGAISRYGSNKFLRRALSSKLYNGMNIEQAYTRNLNIMQQLATSQNKLRRSSLALCLSLLVLWILARAMNSQLPYTFLVISIAIPWIFYFGLTITRHYYNTVNTLIKKKYPYIHKRATAQEEGEYHEL